MDPDRLVGALRPFGQWLYGLDELSDFYRDKAARSSTYFGASGGLS